MKLKKVGLLIAFLLVFGTMCGCSSAASPDRVSGSADAAETKLLTETVAATETAATTAATEATTLPPETKPALQGRYTLEECQNRNGFYIRYEDGSFDRYQGTGYLANYKGYNLPDELFLDRKTAENVPVLDKNTQIVVFTDSGSSIMLYPAYGESLALRFVADNGDVGYAWLESNTTMSVMKKGDYNSLDYTGIETINGKPAEEYDAEKTIVRNRNFSSYYEVTLYGFKPADTVTIGTASGTKLVEKTFDINTYCYECSGRVNEPGREYEYFVWFKPSVEGYGVLDFSEIPSGNYAMVLNLGRQYIAALLRWQNEA